MSIFIFFTALASPSGPWSEYLSAIGPKGEKVNELCGSSLTATYDTKSYPNFDPATDLTRSACQQAVESMGPLCTIHGNQGVKKLKSVTCTFSSDGTRVERKGEALLIHIDPTNRTIVGKAVGSHSWKSAILETL